MAAPLRDLVRVGDRTSCVARQELGGFQDADRDQTSVPARVHLSSPHPARDEQPWDTRLVEWMSRGSDKAPPEKEQSRRASFALAIVHGIVFAAAVDAAHGYLLLLPAILAVVLCLRLFRWARKRRRSSGQELAGVQPNPFGQ